LLHIVDHLSQLVQLFWTVCLFGTDAVSTLGWNDVRFLVTLSAHLHYLRSFLKRFLFFYYPSRTIHNATIVLFTLLPCRTRTVYQKPRPFRYFPKTTIFNMLANEVLGGDMLHLILQRTQLHLQTLQLFWNILLSWIKQNSISRREVLLRCDGEDQRISPSSRAWGKLLQRTVRALAIWSGNESERLDHSYNSNLTYIPKKAWFIMIISIHHCLQEKFNECLYLLKISIFLLIPNLAEIGFPNF
jgi:hypothetical protein